MKFKEINIGIESTTNLIPMIIHTHVGFSVYTRYDVRMIVNHTTPSTRKYFCFGENDKSS
jgi:hypothetical protein